jgi:hypothetical protein
MKKNQLTHRKPLHLETETIKRLDLDILDKVRGGEAEGGGGELAAVGPTAEAHSCNVACSPAM